MSKINVNDVVDVSNFYKANDVHIGYHLGALIAVFNRLQLIGLRGRRPGNGFSSKLGVISLNPSQIVYLEDRAVTYLESADKKPACRPLVFLARQIQSKIHEMGIPIYFHDMANQHAVYAGHADICKYLNARAEFFQDDKEEIETATASDDAVSSVPMTN
jgi:hypothetical protein